MDLIAVTTIQRAVKPGKEATPTSRAVPPKTETIEVGQPFTAEQDEADELIALGAARKDTAAKPTDLKNTKTSSVEAARQQAEKQAKEAADKADRAPEELTEDELRAELTEQKVTFSNTAKKAELVKLLTDARSAASMI